MNYNQNFAKELSEIAIEVIGKLVTEKKRMPLPGELKPQLTEAFEKAAKEMPREKLELFMVDTLVNKAMNSTKDAILAKLHEKESHSPWKYERH